MVQSCASVGSPQLEMLSYQHWLVLRDDQLKYYCLLISCFGMYKVLCPATNPSLSSSLDDQPPLLLTSWERCLVYFQKDLKLGHTFSFCIFMLPHILFPHPYVLWVIPNLSRLISGIILSIMFSWRHLPFRPLWRNVTHFVLSTSLVFKIS